MGSGKKAEKNENKSQAVITDFRVIAVSGATVDGREITAEEIQEMAEQYDPELYTARVNLEHYMPFFPDAELGGYGDVIELKAEEGEDGKYALLARLRVNENLQKLWSSDQKVFSSIEMISEFADTGKAYLVGLAVTDKPASLGTTRHFVRGAQKSVSHFIDCELFQKDEADAAAAAGDSISKLTNAFNAFLDKFKGPEKTTSKEEKNDGEDVEKLQAQLDTVVGLMRDQLEISKKLSDELNSLKNEPVSGERSQHMGGAVTELQSDF